MGKTISKRDRAIILKHARSAAANGRHALARGLFQDLGISYVEADQLATAAAGEAN